jgi:stage II sporulation protein D
MPDTQKIHIPNINGKHILNICLFRNLSSVDISFDDQNFHVVDLDGNSILKPAGLHRTWRIKVKESQIAVYEYYLVLKESAKRAVIEDKLKQLDDKRELLHIFETGGNIYLNEKLINQNKNYLLAAGPFKNEDEAKHNCKLFDRLEHCNIHRKLVSKGSAILEIFDTENEFFTEINDGFQIVPDDYESWFELLNMQLPMCGNPEKSYKENLTYQGALILEIDENSALSGVNRVSVESYLTGVMNSEAGEEDRAEFLKAMAVSARSQIFAGYGKKHFDEKFNFCCTSHCLRYYGREIKNPVIEQSVKETEGLILAKDDRICDGHYSFCCGGHTENDGILNDNDTISFFSSGKPDSDAIKNLDLKQENQVRDWIFSQPDVYCRPGDDINKIAPAVSVDSFRWEVFNIRTEIEDIIKQKTGEDPGIIYEIIPLKRGVSGRITEIEILGSLKNIKISGEMNIRSALSKTLLNSSCFVVNSELADDSVPMSFTFIGAGTGHGVGLCKTGAVKLDMIGKTYQEILQHYFDKCEIKKIY